jgi:hypothetical protein
MDVRRQWNKPMVMIIYVVMADEWEGWKGLAVSARLAHVIN